MRQDDDTAPASHDAVLPAYDAARMRQARAACSRLLASAAVARDAWFLDLRSPPPDSRPLLINQMLKQINAPVDAAWRELDAAEDAAAAIPATGALCPAGSGMMIQSVEYQLLNFISKYFISERHRDLWPTSRLAPSP